MLVLLTWHDDARGLALTVVCACACVRVRWTEQEVAVVEAMKMQNVLRAERDGEIEDVMVTPGANVGVDEVLITFKKADAAKEESKKL